jgi:hypothetical protein
MRFLTLIAAVVALNVLAETSVVRLSEPVEATEAYEVFGAPLPDKNPGLSLQEIIERESDLVGREVRVSTRIAKVCQKKGCFFIATEGDAWARITFADYGFFIPTDSGGKQATLVGTFSRQELSPERAAHYEMDLGEQSNEKDIPPFEYSIVATSVLIPRS